MELVKESSLTIKDIHVDAFVPNPDNVNEMSVEELKNLCDHISEVGFIDPVEAVPIEDGKYMILGGEHRWRAAKKVGMSYVPTILLTDQKWTESDFFDLVSFKLNNIKGSPNAEKFMRVYERMAQKFGPDNLKNVFAVTDKSVWKKLTKSIKAEAKKSGMPDEVLGKIDQAEKQAKDFDQFTKYMNKILNDHTNTANGCIVFVSGKKEHVVIQASDKLMMAVKAMAAYASANQKTVGDYLEGPILEALGRLK